MNTEMNTCWEYFTYNNERYKRQYLGFNIQKVYWMKFKDNSPYKSTWNSVYDYNVLILLEEQYQEFIKNEKRVQKLKRILNE
jgi:hypothetical protein